VSKTIPLEPVEKPKKKDASRVKYTVFCCQGSDCVKNGAKETLKALRTEIRDLGLKGEVHVIKTQCTDKCKDAPVLIACSACGHGPCGAVWYRKVDEKTATVIAREHLSKDQPVAKHTFDGKK
jgi:(2Fe-2S) ferredoxin